MLGHIMHFVYFDWTHFNIAKFYEELYKRNYIIIYLTARSIGQSERTRDYLLKLRQQGIWLPEGPIILYPGWFVESFKQELITKSADLFKTKFIWRIQKVFSNSLNNPIYAGFGNKETDARAYSTVGVSKERIFIIESNGQITQLKDNKKLSYS